MMNTIKLRISLFCISMLIIMGSCGENWALKEETFLIAPKTTVGFLYGGQRRIVYHDRYLWNFLWLFYGAEKNIILTSHGADILG